MRDTQRQPAAGLNGLNGLNGLGGLIGLLLAEPHRFEFFQAVRLLRQWLRAHGAGEGGADDDADGGGMPRLRFRNRLSLAFPPSDIAAVETGGLENGQGRSDIRFDITPAVLGLLGSTGMLPLHYTERLAAYEQREDDDGPRAFLDILAQRPLAMFCQAWALYRPECMPDSAGEEGFMALLRTLAGAHAGGSGPLAREAFARHAVQLGSRTVSHDAMGGALSEYFGLPFKVVPLVAVWERIPPRQQAQLGLAHCALGDGVALGERLHRCDTRAIIRIGPLGKADFARFLHQADGASALRAMLGAYCMVGVTFEVQLLLRAGDAHGFTLQSECAQQAVPADAGRTENPGQPGRSACGARLGVGAFLLNAPSTRVRDDARYLLQP